MRRRLLAPTVLVALALGSLLPTAIGARAAGKTVNVLYAASLLKLNEQTMGPVFESRTGYSFQGRAAGSLAIVNQVKGKLLVPDVIELADPGVNKSLMGQANGGYVSWYFTFARTALVVAFSPQSRFAATFRAVQRHRLAWYKALQRPGLRLGRTDPNLDPKGYRALFMAHLAERVYHLRNFKNRVFGPDDNPSQIFPEQVLAAHLLTGQVDAAILYLSEARDLGVPYINLPGRVNLGEARYATLYATQHFSTESGNRVRGSPILYSVTIPRTCTNHSGASAFVSFILSKRGRALAQQHGLLPSRVKLHGSRAAVPMHLRHFIARS